MEQFIPKSALVAEIERLENKNCKNSNDFNLGAATYLGMLKQFIRRDNYTMISFTFHQG